MEDLDVMNLFKSEGFKKAFENYSKISGLSKNLIIESFEKGINDYFDGQDFDLKVKYKDNQLCFFNREGTRVKNPRIPIQNKYEAFYTIQKGFNSEIKNLKLNRYRKNIKDNDSVIYDIEVTRIAPGFIIGEYQGLEVWLNEFSLIRKDRIVVGQIIKVIPEEIIQNNKDIKINATRRGEKFICNLLHQMIPEINESTIEITKVFRIEGLKTYIIVSSNDINYMNPSKAIIGIGGSRISEIKKYVPELIEVVDFSEDIERFLKNIFKRNLINYDIDPLKRLVNVLLKTVRSGNYPDWEIEIINHFFPQ